MAKKPKPGADAHSLAPADGEGLAKGLTSYGDRGFSMFLRNSDKWKVFQEQVGMIKTQILATEKEKGIEQSNNP